MKVTVPARVEEIDRCYHTCPYFGLDGGPSPTMICNHPYWNDKGAYAGCIISHPECDNGFPPLCPLYKENGMEPPSQPPPRKVLAHLTEEERETLPLEEAIKLELDRAFMAKVAEIVAKELKKDESA